MKFSRLLLDHFLQTEAGQKGLNFFTDLPTFYNKENDDFSVTGRCAVNEFVDSLTIEPYALEFFFREELLIEYTEEQKRDELERMEKLFEQWEREGKCQRVDTDDDEYEDEDEEDDVDFDKVILSMTTKKEFESVFVDLVEHWVHRNFRPYIPCRSLFWYLNCPEFAFPYFYPQSFFQVQEICAFFDIPLPLLPLHSDHQGMCLYYLKFCNTMLEFRQCHQLSPVEMCVFFYCFAPLFIQKDPRKDNLPNPMRVWISGANAKKGINGNGDGEFLEKANNESISIWQGNTETLPGDVVLMYETSPRSCISGIWRAVSPGYLDPFAYYGNRMWISKHIRIPDVSQKELRQDPIWKEKDLVKQNMQGVSGRAVSWKEYEALQAILERKGFDTSQLPQLPEYEFQYPDIYDERDVEEKLLEPFLKRLGISPEQWKRQMPIRMGRGIRIYPDYVIEPIEKRNDERGKFIWEAKFRIPNNKQLLEDVGQAKSYARRLQTKGLGLASIEGIWLSFESDGFEFAKLVHYTWQELADRDTFAKVSARLTRTHLIT